VGAGLAAALVYRLARPGAESLPALETAAHVDLERYQGRWFEIARYPAPWQRCCAKNTTAEYALRRDGSVVVENRCTTAAGRVIVARAVATVADAATNAKLKVKFNPFLPAGDYWIIDRDAEYRYAVVGEPRRRFLWVLSRTPSLDDATFAHIRARLTERSYDPQRLERTPQDGG